MKTSLGIAFGLGLLFQSQALSAQQPKLSLDYSTFYSHLKKIDDEDMSQLQFAFGFMHVEHKQLCHIEEVQIITPKVTLDAEILQNRFLLPTEKALKQARATVEIALQEPNNQCDMSVQLETKAQWLREQYQQSDLLMLFAQYENFFDDMGSFLSFMMPSVNGLQFHFDNPQTAEKVMPNIPWNDGKVVLSKDWIMSHQGLTLSVKPLRITALTQ